MTNKEKIKKTISNDYDKNRNYNIITNKIERGFKMKKYFKYSIVPICLVVALSVGLILNSNQKEFKNNPENELIDTQRINIKINELKEISATKLDADAKVVNNVMIPYYEILNGLVIPDDFDNKDTARAIWVKSNRNSNDYDVLNNYEFDYFNTKNNRRIIIALSDTYKPLRDYYFTDDGAKISKINDIELKIYKYENVYMTAFTYKGFNFDIETTDVTETEFIKLLDSLIKK